MLSFQINLNCFQIFSTEFKEKNLCIGIFTQTDRLSDSSDKYNSVTAKATGLIFHCSMFNVASAWEVPFGVPQYIQCILHGLTNLLLCVPFIFADSKKWNIQYTLLWSEFNQQHSSINKKNRSKKPLWPKYSHYKNGPFPLHEGSHNVLSP